MSILLLGDQIVSSAVAAADNPFSRGDAHPFFIALSGIGGGPVGLGGLYKGALRRFPGRGINQAVIALVDLNLKIMSLLLQLFDFPESLVLADAQLMGDFFNIRIAVC